MRFAPLILLFLIFHLLSPTPVDAGSSVGVTITARGYISTPLVTALSPTNNASGVSVDTNLTITFDQSVDAVAGFITIMRAADGSVLETINVISPAVTGSGTNTITINPGASLAYTTAYYILIENTCFENAAHANYPGMYDSTSWRFTSEAAPGGGGGGGGEGGSGPPGPPTTPVTGEVVTPAQAFASIAGKFTRVWTFDPIIQWWQLYDTAPGAPSTLTAMTIGQGYWLEVTEDVTLTYGENVYELEEGWNVIGWRG